MWIFHYLKFERSYETLKSNSLYFLLNKNTNFNKRTRNRKMKIAHTILERQILRFSSQMNHESKVKLWWVGTRKRKKQFVFSTVYFVQSNFSLCFILIYSVFNIYIHFYILQNNTFCLFLKLWNAVSVSLKTYFFPPDIDYFIWKLLFGGLFQVNYNFWRINKTGRPVFINLLNNFSRSSCKQYFLAMLFRITLTFLHMTLKKHQ